MRDKDDNKIPYTTIPNDVLMESALNNEQKVWFDVCIQIFKTKRKSKNHPKEWQVECEGFYPTTRASNRLGIPREQIPRILKRLQKKGMIKNHVRKPKEYRSGGRIYHRDTYFISLSS
ncbi:hypothetical protein ACFLWZ_04565 [Chloroflexota bacterium]